MSMKAREQVVLEARDVLDQTKSTTKGEEEETMRITTPRMVGKPPGK
jgi:hypothetical protein